MWFAWDSYALTLAQAAGMALPGVGLPAWARRFRTGAWALWLPLSIAVVVALVATVPESATTITRVALVMVPLGAALALGWAAAGGRWWLAPLVVPALWLAVAHRHTRAGEVAVVLLITASAVTAGRLLAGVTPYTLLKLGVIAMAIIDAHLVFTHRLQHSAGVLDAAAPGHNLPQLQSARLHGATLGYGDFLSSAVVGAVLAAQRGRWWAVGGALAMLPVTLAWDQWFLVFDTIPDTVPPAIVLVLADALYLSRRPRTRAPRRHPPPSA
ncbi:MAG: hypothetical protein U0Y82_10185 [Thermoleophilia bacterium]